MRYEKGSFIVVPNKEALQQLDAYSQLVFLWLCEFADNEGACWPSRTTLAQRANISLKSVDRSLSSLIKSGLIVVTPRYHEQAPTTNYYQLMLVQGGSVLGTLGSVPQTRGVASDRRTELNPVLTQKTADADFVISEEKPEKPPKPEKATYEPLLTWAESRTGRKFLNRVKQYSALKKAKDNGISISQLKTRWYDLEEETWRDGFDWTSVVSSFDKR